ncbi:MAG: heme ABC exporter ATP-binding protein CcmA [Nitrospinae bacterium]|nr:heme ABC exporter ATP-binding protein CcmA [Nitrospinota bacterium]
MTSQNINSPLIELRSIVKRFGRVTALDHVDLGVAAGESLTIFGPNGAGKTTLLRMIAGLVKPSGGELMIAGEDVTHGHHDELRRRIGYISHQSLVYADLTAMENLVFFARLYGVADPERKGAELLDEVGLKSRADDTAGTFSRGMRQRLSIARALVNDPDIILLDEPFTGLDQHAAGMLMNLLSRLRGEKRTIVMITHNLEVGLSLGTRVAVQAAGKIRFDRAAAQIDRASFHDTYNGIVGSAHY